MGIGELSGDYLLDEYATCMAKGFLLRTQEIGHDVWPSPVFHPVEGHVYVARHFFPKLYRLIKKLENEGYNDKKIANLLQYPSKVARITYLFHVLHFSGLPKDARVELATKLLRFLTYLRKDAFVKSGKNIILNDSDLNLFLKNFSIYMLNKKNKNIKLRECIGKICAILWTHCELLYFCHHQLGHEIHGPYPYRNGELLIRDYYSLNPEFWSELDFPLKQVVIVTIHKNSDIKFDYSNRMYSSKDLSRTLVGYSISGWTKDDLSDINKLEDFYLNIEKYMMKNIKYISKLNKIELMKKFGEAYFYSIKPLCDAISESWKPPKEFYKDVEEQTLGKLIYDLIIKLREFKNLPENKKFEFVKKIVDPRNYD